MPYDKQYEINKLTKKLKSAEIVNKEPLIYRARFNKELDVLVNPVISLNAITFPKNDPVEHYIALYLTEIYEPTERLKKNNGKNDQT